MLQEYELPVGSYEDFVIPFCLFFYLNFHSFSCKVDHAIRARVSVVMGHDFQPAEAYAEPTMSPSVNWWMAPGRDTSHQPKRDVSFAANV